MVRHLDVEFESGLTILTGETGAGKSILVGALGLALGDRADSSLIRVSADRATVSATFDITANAALKAFLRDNELEDGSACILRRVLGHDGRSRAFCNASPIPVQLLRQIGEFLVDIQGQHAHQSLLRRPIQRDLLDAFGHCGEQVATVAKAHREWHDIAQRRDNLSGGAEDVVSRIDLLGFQVAEIAALDITTEGLIALEAEHRRIAHAERLLEGSSAAAEHAFAADGGALSGTIKAAGLLRELTQIDAALVGVVELLDQSVINLEEAERELSRLRSTLDTDPSRLQQIDDELQTIHDIARKHRCDPVDLPRRLDAIKAELDDLSNREETIAQLNSALAVAASAYRSAAVRLHRSRVVAAKKMNRDISGRLRELGIPHGEFAVHLESNDAQPSRHGDDDIEFLVTANPDHPLRPLKKVASGGELSRIALAIQVAVTRDSDIPVLVFDEVDSGVGGATAEVVSQYLAALAKRRQILCITHLPQVASAGDHHLSIAKIVARGITETTIRTLVAEERIDEIARMLGGRQITDKARDHARELLA